MSSIKDYFNLVKFAHTIFALPFALIGFTMGVLYLIEIDSFSVLQLFVSLALVLVCMVSARNAAMGYNRYADRDIDALNPRTATREIPSGVVSPSNAKFFIILNVVVFIIAAGAISWVCLLLSPIVLFILLGYSKMKRVSAACHFVLGVSLGLAPLGAFIAVLGRNFTLDNISVIMNSYGYAVALLSLIVVLWVSGFDILYSLSDEEFDKQHRLHSMPALFGRVKAMRISLCLHIAILPLLTILFYLLFFFPISNYAGISASMIIFAFGMLLFSTLLIFQHLIISPKNLARLNAAFFTTNGLASFIFAVFSILALLLKA